MTQCKDKTRPVFGLKGWRIKNILLLVNLIFLSTACGQGSIKKEAPEAAAGESALSFGDIPNLEEAFIDAAPTDRKDGIEVGVLGLDGGNKAMILNLAQELAAGKYGKFDSYLIAHKGKLIFESYYRKGRINLPHPQASATKSYTSLAIGRAIQLGYLNMADLDKPLVSFLKDLDPAKFVEGAEKITLHQAMTMRSGIRISEEQKQAFEKTPGEIQGQALVQAYLEHSEPITTASQTFKYQSDPVLVMQVLEAVVPGTAKDFIKKELLDKLGITAYGWEADLSGLPKAGSRSSMTSRDMIKWGTMIMNKGKWQGEQLIPADFVARATSKMVDQSAEYDDGDNQVTGTAYGYFFWQADLSLGNQSYLSKAARGGSGQIINVIEALDLVVVSTTHRDVDDPVGVTATRLLPAFVQNAQPMANPVAYGSNGICLSNTEGTSIRRLTRGDHGYPAWSPDGQKLAFYGYYDNKKTWSIHTVNRDGTDEKRITHVKFKWDNMPAWSPDGNKIVFAREYNGPGDVWQHELWSINADGSEETQLTALRGGGPSFTPDGRLVFHSEYSNKESEISIANLDGSNLVHLTNNEAEEWDPKVSPDGQLIAFTSNRHGNHEVYVMNIDGTNQRRLTHNDIDDYGPSWSPDGQHIVFQSKGPGASQDDPSNLYIMNKDGSAVRKIVMGGWQPAWLNTL